MGQKTLLELLNEHSPTTQKEIQCKNQMISFIKKHDDCFERSLKIGHITGSAWLVSNDGTQALLLHHAKLDRWFQLGGHCDGSADVLDVAIKEAQEESGIQSITPINEKIFDIDIHLIPANSREQAHYHYDVRFLLRVTSDELIIQNHESKELKWIGKNPRELPTDSPSVVRMYNKWRAMT